MARRKQYIIADPSALPASAAQPAIVADGNYPATPGYIDFEGGIAAVFVAFTAGTGTAKLQIQCPDGVTWVDVGATTSFTVSGTAGFTAPAGRLRVNVAGSAGASIKSWIVSIPSNNGG